MKSLVIDNSEYATFECEYENSAMIAIITLKKGSPTEDEWKSFTEGFRFFLEYLLVKNNYKYIMIVNANEGSVISRSKIKDITEILNKNEETILKSTIYTTIVIQSTIMKGLFNFFLKFYKNKRPVLFDTDYEKVYNNVKESIGKNEVN